MKSVKSKKTAKIDKKLAIGFFVFLMFLMAVTAYFLGGSEKFTFFRALQAAVVQVGLVISPAMPTVGTIYPDHVEKGDTIVVRIQGKDFISGFDPVEKITLSHRGETAVVYSADVNVKDEKQLSSTIDTSSLPVGLYDLRVVNQFMGRDIVSTTATSLLISPKVELTDGASLPIIHTTLESALDYAVPETVGISNKYTTGGSLTMDLPSNFLSDDSKILNLKVDAFDYKSYVVGAGDSGTDMPNNMGDIGAVYDIKFSTSDNQPVASTDKQIMLSFKYDPAVLAQKGITPSTLKIYHWNVSTGAWEAVSNSVVSEIDNTVSGAVSQFSPYTALGNYACSDGIDNDGDGKIDYPADPACKSPRWLSEDKPRPFTGGGTVYYYPKVKAITTAPQIANHDTQPVPSVGQPNKVQTPIVNIVRTNGSSSIVQTISQAVASPANSLITKTLQFGLKDDQVRLLQIKLMKAGVYSGPITGYFGDMTRVAVLAYQKRSGILQIGVVGPVTQARLNASTVTKTLLTPNVSSQTSSKKDQATKYVKPLAENFLVPASIKENGDKGMRLILYMITNFWKGLWIR
ncbi:MAG: peptidoglycan-binding protein [Candidatus Vogelbacteria bacterium]|nr:peptidoglycan-binding protein [Candidatus Vogelbacteria bacterium]